MFVGVAVTVSVAVLVGKGVAVGVSVAVGERTGVLVAVFVGPGVDVIVGVSVAVAVEVGKGVSDGVAVGGGGTIVRISEPGETTITPGVAFAEGVTTTNPTRFSGVGEKVGATIRVAIGVGVSLTKIRAAEQLRSTVLSASQTSHRAHNRRGWGQLARGNVGPKLLMNATLSLDSSA